MGQNTIDDTFQGKTKFMNNTIEHPVTLMHSMDNINREVTQSDLKRIQKNNFVSSPRVSAIDAQNSQGTVIMAQLDGTKNTMGSTMDASYLKNNSN